jgi:hypothetical protein
MAHTLKKKLILNPQFGKGESLPDLTRRNLGGCHFDASGASGAVRLLLFHCANKVGAN